MDAFPVVAALARTSFSTAEASTARELLAENTDWQGFVGLSKFHNVVPLVYSGVRSVGGEDLVPAEALQTLAGLSRAVACENMMIAGELAAILREMSVQDIEVMPMRGVALAAWLYGDVTLRMFGDIDILVRRRDLLEAKAALTKIGVQPKVAYDGAALRKLIRSDCEWHFESQGGTHVELHWRIFQPKLRFAVVERKVFDRSIERHFMGQSVRCFSPTDLAIMMAIHHGGKHRWYELRHVCDFAELMRSGDLDWDDLVASARRTGSLRYILVGLAVVRHTLGNEIPQELADVFRRDPMAEEYGRDLATRLAGGRSWLIGMSPVIYYMRNRSRFIDRLRYAPWLISWGFVSIFKPTDKELRYVSLPPALRFLLVPLRLARLTVKYLGFRRESYER